MYLPRSIRAGVLVNVCLSEIAFARAYESTQAKNLHRCCGNYNDQNS